jgi:hypothetical protein
MLHGAMAELHSGDPAQAREQASAGRTALRLRLNVSCEAAHGLADPSRSSCRVSDTRYRFTAAKSPRSRMKPFLRSQLARYAQRQGELEFLLSREDIMRRHGASS